MKKLNHYIRIGLVFLTTTLPIACNKDLPNLSVSSSPMLMEDKNDGMERFAKAVSSLSSEASFRELIKNEATKQFDYDYDVLFRFISERKLSTNLGLKTVRDLLVEKIEVSDKFKELSKISYFDMILNNTSNLQISVSKLCKSWDPVAVTPKTAVLPIDYDERTHQQVNSYDKEGKIHVVTKEDESREVFLVVRESERVDKKGLIRVTSSGFVIPENQRTFTADNAYAEANKAALEGKLEERNNTASIVTVLTGQEMLKIRERLQNEFDAKFLGKYKSKPADLLPTKTGIENGRIASCNNAPQKPSIIEAFPSDFGAITINWSTVNNADGYIVYRKEGFSGNFQQIAVTTANNPTFSNYTWTVGNYYEYRVAAYNGTVDCQSPLSDPKGAFTSWRQQNFYEVVSRIFIDDSCNWWITGLFDNNYEFEVRPVRFNLSESSVEMSPIQLSSRAQLDRLFGNGWLSFYTTLFRWDMQNYSNNYYLHVIEDDGDGQGFEVSIGAKFGKAPGPEINASIKFNISNYDENMGFANVYHFENQSSYSLQPESGSAIIEISQTN